MIKLEDEILFWQARIKITQAPELFKPVEIPESAIPDYQRPEDIRTFLYDPFGEDPPVSYGIEFNAGDNIEVVFFTKAKSENEALKLGNAWLSNLRFKFKGLDGRVEARPISNKPSKNQTVEGDITVNGDLDVLGEVKNVSYESKTVYFENNIVFNR